jgi:hypothetical protein
MFSYCIHPSLTGAILLCIFNEDHVFIVGQGKTDGGRMRFLTCPDEFIETLEEVGEHDFVMEEFWEAYTNYHLYLARSRRPYEVELDDGISAFLKQHCLGCDVCWSYDLNR